MIPLILVLGTRYRWDVSVMPWQLCCRGDSIV